MRGTILFGNLVGGLSLTLGLYAQSGGPSGGPSTSDLQKEVQNPVASLISVPFQNNTNFPLGTASRVQDVLNIQPVVPINLTKDWNLITRWIMPVLYQPVPNAAEGGDYGIGDLNPTFFMSPANSGKVIWGLGPTLLLAHRHREDSRAGKMGRRSIACRAYPARPLDDWCARE